VYSPLSFSGPLLLVGAGLGYLGGSWRFLLR
jgi:hypothetical protein